MTQLIKEGERSVEVLDVQTRLRALGIDVTDEPSYFGASTKHAVRTFQQNRAILVDGIVGPNTWRELVEAGWRLGDRALYLRHPPIRGDDVAALQTRLNALGFDARRADGIFGVNTDAAVRAFQNEYAVAEDGIFGPKTHAALIGLRVDRPGTAADLREELRRSQRSDIAGALVVIDPGHGADDPGIAPVDGRTEAEICWDLSVRLAERLLALGAHVRLTRSETENPDISGRAALANDVGADVFVSIHLNAHDEPTAEGSSAYYFHGSRAGEVLADGVQDELMKLGFKDCRCHPRSYPILKETRMPAVIVEPGFITNALERERLRDPRFRNAIADAIAFALRRYYHAAFV